MSSNLVDDGSGTLPIDPRSIQIHPASAAPAIESRAQAASRWLGVGFRVIPIVPGEKRTALKWDAWLERLSADKVEAYWRVHHDHDVGVILGDGLIVFDADSLAAVEALDAIERQFGVSPNMIVKTRRGVHHFYRRAPDTAARSDSHDSVDHPERVDVKTGRALVVLPPSGGRELVTASLRSVADLVEVGQDFVDAVFAHNGRPAPRSRESTSVEPRVDHPLEYHEAEIEALLGRLDPDCGYTDWLSVLMAVHYETAGGDSGLAIVDTWSRRGRKYKGINEVERKWRSFQSDAATAYSMTTLMRMVEATGVDPLEILAAVGPQFEPCEYVVVDGTGGGLDPGTRPLNPLREFSLRGRSEELERHVVEHKPLLGELALQGQATIFYAAPNTGKTLITLALVIEAIVRGRVVPDNLFYVNVDDTSQGLLEKNRIAEEYEFHMIGDGHQGFDVNMFARTVSEITKGDQARGIVIIVDTLKKCVDLMDKSKSASFMKVVRRFVVKGGTFIGLAHVNKNPGANGKPVFSGTSDFRDDCDCAYTVAPLDPVPGMTEKVVVYENIKSRGPVAQLAGYAYSIEHNSTYHALLASVHPVDPMKIEMLKEADVARSDLELIAIVLSCLRAGVQTKMRLVDAVAERAAVSNRTAIRIIERYSGDDPLRHRWRYTVRARGAKVYEPLDDNLPAFDRTKVGLAEGGRDE